MCKSEALFSTDQIIIFYYLLIFNVFCWGCYNEGTYFHILHINFALSKRLCVSNFPYCSRLSRNTEVLSIEQGSAGEKAVYWGFPWKGLDKLLILWGYTRRRLVRKMLQPEMRGRCMWYFYWSNGWSFLIWYRTQCRWKTGHLHYRVHSDHAYLPEKSQILHGSNLACAC